MSAKVLKIGNRDAYFRKSITSPDFNSERVLARDAFDFVSLWMSKNGKQEARDYWTQAQNYFQAGQVMPPVSAPLAHYYCFLNAAKALLVAKGKAPKEYHGVGGKFVSSKRSLSNEIITFKAKGVVAELSEYLKESEKEDSHSLKDILSNLPFIHRAFRLTYTSEPDKFIPLRKLCYRRHPKQEKVWFSAIIEGSFADTRSLPTIPDRFEIVERVAAKSENSRIHEVKAPARAVVRSKKRAKWFGQGASISKKTTAMNSLNSLHQLLRRDLVYISAAPDLWYLKREVSGGVTIERYGLTLIISAMHRLSELARYDPKGLMGYFERKENWLLSEFIQMAPAQFIDEIACEITSLECALPGIRPRII